MNPEPISEEAETIVREATVALFTPRAGECLVCFVYRQLTQFDCDNTHRFAISFRDQTAPRATALISRLSSMGACCCDCEMFLNAYQPAMQPWPSGRWETASDGLEVWVEAPPSPMPPCRGVHRGSTRPCRNWERIRRW